MRAFLTFGLALAGSLALSSPAAALQTFCVSSTAQFDTAWQAGADDDVEIRMVTGAFNLAGSCVDTATICDVDRNGNTVRIRGGYNAGCGSRVTDPGATELIATGRDLNLQQSALGFDRLRIRSANTIFMDARDGELAVDRVRLDDIGRIVLFTDGDQLSLRNSLITRSGTGDFLQSVVLGSQGGPYLVEHNTFTRNFKPVTIGPGTGTFRSNVLWDNGGVDLEVQAPPGDEVEVSVRNNLWSNATGLGNLAVAPSGTLTQDPQFVNPSASDFRLQAGSPAISTAFPASSLLVQQDYAGGPRWFGEAPDRGAFESAIGTTAPLITVQNANDSGTGSLRQAILDANALPNVNRIEFDIGTTCGPQVIALNSPLPAITQPVVIDGYTQPGAARNTLTTGSNAVRCIAITGGGSVTNGISTASNDSASVTLDGLGFGGFSLIAVNLTGGNGHRFVGSQFGGAIGSSATPLTLASSVNGLQVGSLIGASAADGVEVGGDTPAERNVFSDVADAAIRIGAGAEDARVVNNYIGIGPSGALSSEGNRDGVVINGRNNEVRGNVISNNTRHGVYLTGGNARANRVLENRIGIEAFCNFGICSTTLGNTADGVRLDNAANDNRIEGNIIRHNGDDGVVITGAQRNAVLRNVITDNTEQPIDLGDDGTSANGNNSGTPPPSAGNFGQNRPLLLTATGTAAAGTAQGTLASANGTYRIDFYSAINCGQPFINPTPSGEPETWLGTTYATITNGSASFDGNVAFSALIGVAGDPGFFGPTRRIVATATRMAGSSSSSVPRGTSEVSSCITYDVQLFKDGFETP